MLTTIEVNPDNAEYTAYLAVEYIEHDYEQPIYHICASEDVRDRLIKDRYLGAVARGDEIYDYSPGDYLSYADSTLGGFTISLVAAPAYLRV